jgi:FAD/FMN-containing dehydrogenase
MSDIRSIPIQGTILTRSSGDKYKTALHRFSALSILEPKYIVLPSTFSDIPIIVAYATSQSPPIEIAVKSGGTHCAPWASSDGGLVIDLARLNNVVVSEDKRSVLVQGGALWGDVYKETQKFGVDVVGAHFWFVGVAGYLLGGGYSRLTGEHGLGLDNILAATVILADGRVVRTSPTEEPELFWAIRGVFSSIFDDGYSALTSDLGGGNQFGIVVEFVLRAFPAAQSITMGSLVYPRTEMAHVQDVVRVSD